MSIETRYVFGNDSDVGKKRKINQDSFGTAKNEWGEVFIVADGMGGHKGGEVASRITVDHLCNEFKVAGSDTSPAVFLERSINGANEAVSSKAKEGADFEGMGTTVVAVIIKDEEAHIAHVGDSRVYIFRNGQPYFMTKDHSFVQDLVDQGLISEEEAEDHPKKNRILQAIGTGSIKPDITTLKLYKGDQILLCSDGLSGEVRDLEMITELKSSNPMDGCKSLVRLANDRGGPDNITVIAIHVEKGNKPPKYLKVSKKKISKYEWILVFLILFCLGMILFNKIFQSDPPPPTMEGGVKKPSITESANNDSTQASHETEEKTESNTQNIDDTQDATGADDKEDPKEQKVQEVNEPADSLNQQVSKDQLKVNEDEE